MKDTETAQAEKHFALGLFYTELGRTKDAVREYKLVLKNIPDHGEALINLGRIYIDQDKIHLGMACYNKALSAHNALSLVPYIYFNWGEVAEKNDDPLTSIYYYKKALVRMRGGNEIETILSRISGLSKELLK